MSTDTDPDEVRRSTEPSGGDSGRSMALWVLAALVVDLAVLLAWHLTGGVHYDPRVFISPIDTGLAALRPKWLLMVAMLAGSINLFVALSGVEEHRNRIVRHRRARLRA